MVVFAILLVVLVTNIARSSAEIDPQKAATITNCDQIYPDLQRLGLDKFKQRHMYNNYLRDCLVLYNHFAWGSNDPDRAEKLAEALDTRPWQKAIRDRPTQGDGIPQWIRDDATRWYRGDEKDTIISYGIRHLINSGMIAAPSDPSVLTACQDRICLSEGDYLTYSITETNQDTYTLKHTVQSVAKSTVVLSERIAREGRTTGYLEVGDSGLVYSDPCCTFYQFAHKLPLEVGSKVDSARKLQITHEIVFAFKDEKRPAFLAWDDTGYYHEVIDEQTGILLFSKQQDNIQKVTKTVSLTDTNAFSKDVRIQYEDPQIPPWLRSPIKWWSQGLVSDGEYLAGLSYLLKNGILRI